MEETIEKLLQSGQTLLNTGNPKEAMTVFDKVLKIDPNQIDALIKKGNILGKLGKYENMIMQFYTMTVFCYKKIIICLHYSTKAWHTITLDSTKLH